VKITRPAKTPQDYLGIYLNDHLAGATSGMELARRMAGSAEPGSESAVLLKKVAAEITADRAVLIAMMAALGVPVRGYKVFGAWAGEKAGRVVKLNGHLLSRSPLSDLEETEILRLGITGKAAGWRTLRTVADTDRRLDAAQLDELLAKASRQEDELEDLRVRVANGVLSDWSK